MQIKRNYSEPFFRGRRRKRSFRKIIFFLAVILVVLFIGYTQFDRILVITATIFSEPPTPTPVPADLASQASGLFASGNMAQAVTLYQAAIEQRPDNVDYLYEAGQILIDLDDPTTALEYADHILEIAPNDPRGFALKARGLVWDDSATSAIPVGLAGLEVDPNFAPLYAAISRAYTNTDRWQDGVEYGDLAVQLAPADIRAHWSYAHALTSVGAFDEALNELETIRQLHPAFVPPLFELAFLYLARDLDEDAIAIYDLILSMEPRNARAHLRQCEVYRKIGQFDRAIGFCEDAARYNPDSAETQFRLAMLYYVQRRFPEAKDTFARCLEQDNSSVECNYRYGLTHYYTGDCQTAFQILEDSLIMAQARDDANEAIENIRQGMNAIISDPNCTGVSNQALFGILNSTPTPEG